jgi:hypothetical protein
MTPYSRSLICGGLLAATAWMPAANPNPNRIALSPLGTYANGKPLLVVGNEVSGGTTVFEINKFR